MGRPRRRPRPTPHEGAAHAAAEGGRDEGAAAAPPDVDLAGLVAAEVARATAPPPPVTAVCDYCGVRYLPRGGTREVAGAGGRTACGWCIALTDRSDDDPLTEEKLLDSAVCRLVGMRQTRVGASSRVPLVPFYALEGVGPSRQRWAFVDRDALVAAFDAAYPPSRFSGKVVQRRVMTGAKEHVNGYTQGVEKLLPPEFVPAPPAPSQPSPHRPPTEAERMREQIETKRRLAEERRRRRSAEMARATREMARLQRRIATLSETNGHVPIGSGAGR